MTTGRKRATAGLIFTDFRDLDIVEIANLVTGSFEALGHRVTGTHVISDSRASITTTHHEFDLVTREDVDVSALPDPAASYLAVAIARTGAGGSTFARDSLLARVLQTLFSALKPDYVKWIDTDVVLTSADFARATGLAPEARRPVSTCKLPDVEETNDLLQQRISDHDPAIFGNVSSPERLREIFDENWVDPGKLAAEAAADARAREEADIEDLAPRRLSAWMMSFAVTLFALPVGVTLMVLNMSKGENLRLTSQAAALTGTFIALQTFGSTAHAMSALQGILG